MAECWLPYQPQYPSGRSREYSVLLKAIRPAPVRYHQSYRGNQLYSSQCQPTAPRLTYPCAPQYNAEQPVHLHPSNRSCPDLLPRCSASSTAAPSSPSIRKSRNHHAGDKNPSHRRQSSPILPLDGAAYIPSYSSHIIYGGLLASNHHAHLEAHDQSTLTSNNARSCLPSRSRRSILLRHLQPYEPSGHQL